MTPICDHPQVLGPALLQRMTPPQDHPLYRSYRQSSAKRVLFPAPPALLQTYCSDPAMAQGIESLLNQQGLTGLGAGVKWLGQLGNTRFGLLHTQKGLLTLSEVDGSTFFILYGADACDQIARLMPLFGPEGVLMQQLGQSTSLSDWLPSDEDLAAAFIPTQQERFQAWRELSKGEEEHFPFHVSRPPAIQLLPHALLESPPQNQAGAWKALAPFVRQDILWASVRFPQGEGYIRFDGFFFAAGRWRWLPKPWRALREISPLM